MRTARFGVAAAAVSLAVPAFAGPHTQIAIAGDWLTDTRPLVPAAGPCPISSSPYAAPAAYAQTKTAAIIGEPSALEAMRASQGGASLVAPIAAASPVRTAPRALMPAAGNFNLARTDCGSSANLAQGARLSQQFTAYSSAKRARGDFLESRRVPIKHTFFDSQWSRVSKERPQLGRMASRIEAIAPTRAAKLRAVNLWVNRRISYVEDSALFGRADYWAGAKLTLALGKGDCEDFALLKMHMLAEMGIAREDMVLTIARDLVKRQDHAVLLVKNKDGGFVMLDNANDLVLDASRSYDYRPVLSFSANRAWIHGY